MIFISIDDNEQAQLKLLCDEIFGQENFVATFKWNKTSKAPTLSKRTRSKYEYIICYTKNSLKKMRGKDSYNTEGPLFNSGNNTSIVRFPQGTIDCLFEDGLYEKS